MSQRRKHTERETLNVHQRRQRDKETEKTGTTCTERETLNFHQRVREDKEKEIFISPQDVTGL